MTCIVVLSPSNKRPNSPGREQYLRKRQALLLGEAFNRAGWGLSNDIAGNLLAPAEEGQLRAMRDAYLQAGWRPSDVDLIECHATGTPVGDAVEFASLAELWKDEAASPGRCELAMNRARPR